MKEIRKEDLWDAIHQVDDRYLEEVLESGSSHKKKPAKRSYYLYRAGAVAAIFLVVLAIGGGVRTLIQNQKSEIPSATVNTYQGKNADNSIIADPSTITEDGPSADPEFSAEEKEEASVTVTNPEGVQVEIPGQIEDLEKVEADPNDESGRVLYRSGARGEFDTYYVVNFQKKSYKEYQVKKEKNVTLKNIRNVAEK